MTEKTNVTWGAKFPASENAKNLSEKYINERKTVLILLQEVAQALETGKERFFESILKVHPELEGWDFSYNHKDNTITVLDKKDPSINR